MSIVTDSLEYKLSNPEMKSWAGKVTKNMVPFKTVWKEWMCKEDNQYSIIWDDEDGKTEYWLNLSIDLERSTVSYPLFTVTNIKFSKLKDAYIVRRASKNHPGVTVTKQEVREKLSPLVGILKSVESNLVDKNSDQIKNVLYSYLPKVAQKAIQDHLLLTVSTPGYAVSVREWFAEQEFTNIPDDLIKLKDLVGYRNVSSDHKDYKNVAWKSGYDVVIDWSTKTFKKEPWSSSN
jgi:hypothetical protein